MNLMRSGGIFVQHSLTASDGDTEGLGLSLLEAMACEVPVVVTRHNGFVETVEHNVTGLLVDEHDVKAMAGAIGDLLADPVRAEAMGKAARRRVLNHFTLEHSRTRLRAILGLSGSSANASREKAST
jgi:glycosyltransferase involved in cell wall biosynthesis